MKRLIENLKTKEDILNIIVTFILWVIIRFHNLTQYIKFMHYKALRIPCEMSTDYKLGSKYCYRTDKHENGDNL
jgi:hypothetical protein